MSEKTNHTPDVLYRGITVPAIHINEDFLRRDLVPGSSPHFDEQGRQTVRDGNEYGVYMSDNPHMSEVSYATPRHGDPVADSPTFNWRGASQSRVQYPRGGVMYRIDAKGLGARRPFISDPLAGVYNNGFQGDEFIADTVPAGRYDVIKLKLGPDILHLMREFEVGEDPRVAVRALQGEFLRRSGRLAHATEVIKGMPESRRHSQGFVERALAELREPTLKR